MGRVTAGSDQGLAYPPPTCKGGVCIGGCWPGPEGAAAGAIMGIGGGGVKVGTVGGGARLE